MKKTLAERISELIAWLVFLSLIGLILTLLVPWVSYEENSSENNDYYYSFEMMEKSLDKNIQNLSEQVKIIYLCFWIILFSSCIAFLGLTLNHPKKYNLLSEIILLLNGFLTTALCAVIIFLGMLFLNNIASIENLSTPSIVPVLKYPYIILIFAIVSLLCSVSYLWIVVPHSIKYFKNRKKEDEQIEEKEEPVSEEKIQTISEEDKEKIIQTKPKNDEESNVKEKQSPMVADVTKVRRCSICLGRIKPGLPVLKCKCGKIYHLSCAERVQTCPNCNEKLESAEEDNG